MKNQYDKSPTEEHENPYAFQMMCIMNILPSDWFNDIDDVHDMFAQLGKLIDRCNEYDTPTIDAPRLEVWQDFINIEFTDRED